MWKDKEVERAYKREWYQNRREKEIARATKYNKKNKAQYLAYQKEWREANPNYHREYHEKRKANKKIG